MRILLFGTGEFYQRYKIWFEDEDVIALVDNSKEKQGTYIDGKEVIAANAILNLEYDAVFILTFSVTDIAKQLLDLGVCREKIYSFNYINDFIYADWKRKKISTFLNVDKKKEIVLLSQDLSLGGPALALYNVAKLLQKWGYSVTYASMVDGPLRERLLEDNVSVIIDSNMLGETMKDNVWVENYRLVICNTINFHVFLSNRNTKVPVIWWLHDAEFFYEAANIPALKRISDNNLRVVSVGEIARKAMKKYRPDFEIGNLLYGVETVITKRIKKKDESLLQFVTIGFIEPHKGQDLLIQAIRELPDDIREKCQFLFVGKNASLFAQQLKKEAEKISEIKFVGMVGRNEIHAILDRTDVLICPSRQDCMPTVCNEAMMHFVPCLVSDATGTASYITEDTGRIFRSENIEELKKQIIWFVNHKEKIPSMGEKARKLYETFFSMDAFADSLKKLIPKKL